MRTLLVARVLVVVLVSLALCGMPCNAQSTNAAVAGQITDEQGGVVPDVTVVLTNLNTGVAYQAKSNGDGFYSAPNLLPGIYRANVTKDGFKSIVKGDIELHVQDVASINFQLQVGSMTESVTVEAGGVNVDTTDASVSTVVDRQFVENLPLNGRTFQSLIFLTPGINTNLNITGPASTNLGGIDVNGQRGEANYWMVDGVSANFATTVAANLGPSAAGTLPATNVVGGTSALVSIDAMQEFRTETSTYAPEFGRALGGQISIQTRSGTSQFHGVAFDYFRNGDLDAADWFGNNHGLPKAIEKQNDFGGVIGGPIIKDKAFFFFSYEGFRVRVPVTFLGTVPDLAARQSAIPAMQPYLNAYPLPKPGAADVEPGLAPYSATFANPSSADAYSFRLDDHLAKNLNLFVRYNEAPSSATQRAENGTGGVTANTVELIGESNRTVTVGATWTKSAEMVNDVRFNYSYEGGHGIFVVDNFGGGTSLPAESLFPSPFTYQNAWFAFSTSFGTNMRFNAGGTDPINSMTQYNAADTLTMLKGRHSLKFGVDYRHMSPLYGFGQFLLDPIFSSLSEIQNGSPDITFILNQPRIGFSLHNFSLFGQDTWRVNPRLNVTYGLRWDVDFCPTTNVGPNLIGVTGFNLTDLSRLALGPAGTPLFKTPYGSFGPRIGGAYRLTENPNWGLVLRGGFGVFYDLVNTEIGDAIGSYPQGSYSLASAPFPTPPDVAVLPAIVPPNVQNGVSLLAFDPHLKAPYALEWNVALEQSLGKAQNFSLSYVGARDRRLLATEDITNPNPNYASASLFANVGTLTYDAMQTQFRRALSGGLQALVSYTWSHSIDEGSYGLYANGIFTDVNANRGSSDYDLRQVFSAALTYNVPGLKSNSLARAITSGWSTHNIVQIHSAPPIDIEDANFAPALSALNASVLVRPDIVPGQPFYLYGSQYPGGKALNPAAFTDPPKDPTTGLPTRQGDLSRNAVRCFGLAEWDFAVRREFPIHEAMKLQFSADLFNVLNHPNFGLLNSNFENGNIYFGQATAMQNQLGGQEGWGIETPLYAVGGPRSIQLALKLVF